MSTIKGLLVAALACQLAAPGVARAQAPGAALKARADAEVQPVLATLKELTSIESGSRDLDGLSRIADLIARRLGAAGMAVQVLPSKAPDFHPRLKGAPLGSTVLATRQGTGPKKVLLIAHMDTVYERGMAAKQPFHVDGERAYGLGIADDKGGVALILHTVQLLAELGHRDYAELAVLINADEEIGSPGSAALLTQLGSEYDVVMSFEGTGRDDFVRLATSSSASAELRVTGKASHAGVSPEAGRNALVELAHQIVQTRHLDDRARGLRFNWITAQASGPGNVIPATAVAVADVRARASEDFDGIERQLRELIQNRLVPDTHVELIFRRGRPAFAANAASHALAARAVRIYEEIGLRLGVQQRANGGGTDAAYVGLRPRGGVLEGFGLAGAGSHSNQDEYIFVPSIASRLYLATRMVMEAGAGRIAW
ncbi:MAG: glutamate carboxypeptidase [Rubrivivax sp.]